MEDMRKLFSYIRKALKKPRMPKVHDYFTHKTWGHDYTIHKIINGGMELKLSGFGIGIQIGDVLKLKNGDYPSHYIVDRIEYYNNPSDMWAADVSFIKTKNI